jgi:hypothetical protein
MAELSREQRRAVLRERSFLTPAECGLLINRSKRTINLWIEAGLVTYQLPNRSQRYVRKADLMRWAVRHAKKPRADG